MALQLCECRACRFHSAALFEFIPLVCRRWRRLCQAPELLRQLGIELDFFDSKRDSLLPSLRSLATWMGQAAGHVHSLSLELSILVPVPAAERAEVEALLASMVAVCGAGGLQRLRLATISALRFSSWLGMARSLCSLRLSGNTDDDDDDGARSELTVPLHNLTSLERLSMHDLRFSGARQGMQSLPPSLTSLELTLMAPYLPSQVCTRSQPWHAMPCMPCMSCLAMPCCHAIIAMPCMDCTLKPGPSSASANRVVANTLSAKHACSQGLSHGSWHLYNLPPLPTAGGLPAHEPPARAAHVADHRRCRGI